MPFTSYLMTILLLLGLGISYIVAKIAWYAIRMLGLKHKLKKLNSGDISISFPRKFYEIMFGEMGDTNFVVTTPTETYVVSVISFASTHARWNIEKTKNGYRAEVRRKRFRYDSEYNTGTEPESAREYRKEAVVHRDEFTLPACKEDEKGILLIHPRPRELTYSHVRLEYLCSGDKIEDYTVMYETDFLDLLGK